MTAAKASRLRWWFLGAIFLALLGIYSLTLATGITWRNNGADGGDLVTAAATLGVAHPSGYPTYLIAARLFQAVPIGSLAARTAWLSAVCASTAAIAAMLVVQASVVAKQQLLWVGALLAGFAFGISPLLWSQAVIAEVYCLHVMFAACVVLASVMMAVGKPKSWLVRLGGLLFGLGLGNHLTLVFLLLPWLWVVGWRDGKLQSRAIVETLIAIGAGLLVYMYIPLRAITMPPVNWGNASTLEGLVWLVTAQNYRGLVFGLPPELLVNRIQAWAALLVAQFSWPGLMLALYGLFYGRTASPVMRPITLWIMIAYSAFAIGYGTADSDAYLLPAFLALAIWFGWGVVAALDSVSIAARPLVIAAVALVTFASAVNTLPQVDASRDHAAEDYAAVVIESAPRGAMVFTTNDRDTFPLWYAHFALAQRPDLAIIVEPLLAWQWYGDTLKATYPGLALPDGDLTRANIIEANNGPWCLTQVDAPTPLTCTSP